MEKHKCKLCFKIFMNGKALGGHMSRSHYTNLPLPPKTPKKQEPDTTESSSSEFSSKRKENEEKSLIYGLREHPKKSFKSIDAKFLDAGSVVQDKESETESTRKPTRRRSKRAKRNVDHHDQELLKLVKPDSVESLTELEMISSVSDADAAATCDEDVALCLMMLSRDVWSSDDSIELKLIRSSHETELKHQCDMCNKVFKSSQALGGHRISHRKKMKKCIESNEKKSKVLLHECPFCGKVFASGQALGGHKRSHFLVASTKTDSSSSKIGDNLVMESSNSDKFEHGLIDLNLPAPMEDEEDLSLQQEVFIVSGGDFIAKVFNAVHVSFT